MAIYLTIYIYICSCFAFMIMANWGSDGDRIRELTWPGQLNASGSDGCNGAGWSLSASSLRCLDLQQLRRVKGCSGSYRAPMPLFLSSYSHFSTRRLAGLEGQAERAFAPESSRQEGVCRLEGGVRSAQHQAGRGSNLTLPGAGQEGLWLLWMHQKQDTSHGLRSGQQLCKSERRV